MSGYPISVSESEQDFRLRLFCFSHAGGSETDFFGWPARLHPYIQAHPIQLPGRGKRFLEQSFTAMPLLVREISKTILDKPGLPFAFFGHSLGALIAFELARHLQQHGSQQPTHLFVSGCNSPTMLKEPLYLHRMPDDQLIAELKTYDGTPAEILAHQEIMSLVLPAIRADFRIFETYQYVPGKRLRIPISAILGTEDIHVSRTRAEGWARETAGKFSIRSFSGGHFFLTPQIDAVVDFVSNRLLSDIEIPACDKEGFEENHVKNSIS